MSLKSLRLLNTFCWHSFGAWGDRMLLLIFVFLSSQLQKMSEIYPTPIPFSLMLRFGPQLAFFFSLVALPEAALQGSPSPSSPPSSQPAHTRASSYSLHSKMWCFQLFWVLYCFCPFCFWIFAFLLRLCPEKNKLCMFPAVSSHLPMYHLHLSVFYSLCKNWLI